MTEPGSISGESESHQTRRSIPRATIGAGSSIWGLACIRENAVLGRECIIGRGAYIEDGVILGDRVKVQTNALLFKPARHRQRRLHRPGGSPDQRSVPPLQHARRRNSSGRMTGRQRES